jgi:prepilin-type N-terminal cleavage/methylation domain-containing protein
MSRQKTFNNRGSGNGKQGGFTLVEVLVSIAVMAVGLLSVAALIAGTLEAGTRARFMSMASILASEKLDSLNKWPSGDIPGTATTAQSQLPTDPNIWPGGVISTAPCAAGDQWCDQVTVSEASGADYETQTQLVFSPNPAPNGSFQPQTTTIVHTSAGCVGTPAACGVAQPAAGGATFTRRWKITQDPTINAVGGGNAQATGTRRITVLVTLNDASFNTPVNFQLSMVRP